MPNTDPEHLNAFGEPWIPPTYRRVCVDPVSDLIESCEAMPEFTIDHPERYADLLCAKEAITYGDDLATRAAEAMSTRDALVELVNHPVLRGLFGAIEDSGTPEAARLLGYVQAWLELRDDLLKDHP